MNKKYYWKMNGYIYEVTKEQYYKYRKEQDRHDYELVVVYDKEYGEVIAFESDRFMNDSNDIVNEAIKLKLFEEKYRDKVRWAQCVSEYEFEYIKMRR